MILSSDKKLVCPSQKSGVGVGLTTSVHLVPRLRISGAVPPVPHMPLWQVQRQLVSCITCLISLVFFTLLAVIILGEITNYYVLTAPFSTACLVHILCSVVFSSNVLLCYDSELKLLSLTQENTIDLLSPLTFGRRCGKSIQILSKTIKSAFA